MGKEDKERVNPALLGFIAGTEGREEARRSEEWAKKMSEKYGVDATTILLNAKTFGFKETEEHLENLKEWKEHKNKKYALSTENIREQKLWSVNVYFHVYADNKEEAIRKVCDDIKGNEDYAIDEAEEI